MNVELSPAGDDDRARLAALFALYIYDLSAMLGLDVADDGRFVVPTLDGRGRAFLVRVGGVLAGFAIVAERSRLSGDAAVRDMAEFFVLRKYRGAGVGERAATALFDRFGGTWEVRQKAENAPATAFWRRIIGRYTNGSFEDFVVDDERWRGPVQRFVARAAA
jgi:predicted acetyltransferase